MQVPLGKRFFARVFIDVALAFVRYEYVNPSFANGGGFSTPGVFGDAGLALGMSLR
jgi:hypothetical protein